MFVIIYSPFPQLDSARYDKLDALVEGIAHKHILPMIPKTLVTTMVIPEVRTREGKIVVRVIGTEENFYGVERSEEELPECLRSTSEEEKARYQEDREKRAISIQEDLGEELGEAIAKFFAWGASASHISYVTVNVSIMSEPHTWWRNTEMI